MTDKWLYYKITREILLSSFLCVHPISSLIGLREPLSLLIPLFFLKVSHCLYISHIALLKFFYLFFFLFLNSALPFGHQAGLLSCELNQAAQQESRTEMATRRAEFWAIRSAIPCFLADHLTAAHEASLKNKSSFQETRGMMDCVYQSDTRKSLSWTLNIWYRCSGSSVLRVTRLQ